MVKASPKPKTAFNARSTFVLGVSIGSPSHENASLAAIVSAINGGSFAKGVIDLSDTLKRYQHMTNGLDEAEARRRTILEGDAWLERNQETLEGLNAKSIDIRRWDEWLSHPKYKETRQLFEELYAENEMLREAIDKDIRRFYARSHGVIGRVDPRAYELSRLFFLEELSAHSLLYAEYNGVNLYPGKQLECFKVVRQGLLPRAPQALVSSPYVKLVMHSFERVNDTRHEPRRIAV